MSILTRPEKIARPEKKDLPFDDRAGASAIGSLSELRKLKPKLVSALPETGQPAKVLLIGSLPPPLGGVTVHITRLTEALRKLGYLVSLLNESRNLRDDVPNVRTSSLRDYFALLRRADIVHIHSSNPGVRLYHAVAARLAGKQVVITLHSAKSNVIGRLLYRMACAVAHRAIPVSKEIRESLGLKVEPIPAFLPPSRSEEVVPPELADWMEMQRREGRRVAVSNASNMRLFAGQDLYGLDMLVECFARPDVARKYALLLVVASVRIGADSFKALQQDIERRGLGAQIKLVNVDAPFAGIIANADAVVRATNTDGDALTVREGLWYGKRVLASDCVMRPEGTELFKTRDVDDLAIKLLDDVSERSVVASPDFVSDLDAVYRSCLKSQSRQTEEAVFDKPAQAKKKILVIAQFYAPDITAGAFRISETVGLLRKDADVRVITAVPHKAQAEAAGDRSEEGVVRAWIRPYEGGGAFNYIAHYFSFVVTAIAAGIRLRRSGWRPDVIWVSSPPLFVGIAGDVLRRVMGCPLVLDIRDIWPESAVGAKVITQDGALFRSGKVLERWLYARADRMTCVSQAMQRYLTEMSGKTVHVVYNGILTRPRPEPAAKIEKRILYAGNLGRAQGLDVLIAAFAEAKKRSDNLVGWTVDFIGTGAIEDSLRASVAELGLDDKVRFLGVRDKPSAIAEMRQSAALFINLLSEAVFALTVPSKVFDCMLVGRPILFGVENAEARAILAESGGNIEFSANDQESLTAAIIDLAARLKEVEVLAHGNSDVVLSRYTREEATRELVSALDAALASPRPSAFHRLRAKVNGLWQGTVRQAEFIRHVPARKLLRRGELTAKRQLLQRFPPAQSAPQDARLAIELPLPLMPPRRGRATSENGALRFTLLGKTRNVSLPIAWQSAEQERETQLWWMTLNYMEFLEEVNDDIFASVVDSWMSSVRPYAKGYWRDTFNSFTLSIRTVVWMQQLASRKMLAPSLRLKLADSIAQQLQFLERNLETDLGGNHLIKNVKALIFGSVYFEGKTARGWRERALKLLARELPHQILVDGVHFERSLSYHNQVFVDLLEIRHVLGCDPLAGALDRALAAMAQAIADFAHGDGMPAQFSDAGLHMSYSSEDCLNAHQVVFGSRPEGRSAFAYPDAGYFGLREAETDSLFVVDCGPIGPDDLPGHGHADILSFEWSIAGKRLIVDQGVYEYVAGARRDASRSSQYHNTLSIAGVDQADFFGDFRVGRRAHATLLNFEQTQDGIVMEGRHDGFAPAVHTRHFTVSGSEVTVNDCLQVNAHRKVAVSLLLHPEARPRLLIDGIHIVLGDRTIRLRSNIPFQIEPAVWWPDIGTELETNRLIARWPEGCESATFSLRVEGRPDHE